MKHIWNAQFHILLFHFNLYLLTLSIWFDFLNSPKWNFFHFRYLLRSRFQKLHYLLLRIFLRNFLSSAHHLCESNQLYWILEYFHSSFDRWFRIYFRNLIYLPISKTTIQYLISSRSWYKSIFSHLCLFQARWWTIFALNKLQWLMGHLLGY